MNKEHRDLLRQRYEESCEAYDKQMLKNNFESVVRNYTMALLTAWDIDASDCYWVGNEVGSTYIILGEYQLNLNDMIYCVEEDVDFETFKEWSDYCVFAAEFKQNIPNLKSWHKGCPRLNKEARQKLINLRQDFEAAIKDYKERF